MAECCELLSKVYYLCGLKQYKCRKALKTKCLYAVSEIEKVAPKGGFCA